MRQHRQLHSIDHLISKVRRTLQPISAKTGKFVEQFTDDWDERWTVSQATKIDRNQEVFSYGESYIRVDVAYILVAAVNASPLFLGRVEAETWRRPLPFHPFELQSESGRSRSLKCTRKLEG